MSSFEVYIVGPDSFVRESSTQAIHAQVFCIGLVVGRVNVAFLLEVFLLVTTVFLGTLLSSFRIGKTSIGRLYDSVLQTLHPLRQIRVWIAEVDQSSWKLLFPEQIITGARAGLMSSFFVLSVFGGVVVLNGAGNMIKEKGCASLAQALAQNKTLMSLEMAGALGPTAGDGTVRVSAPEIKDMVH